MELIEPLAGYHFDDRWLVRVGGEMRVLWVLGHHHSPWYSQTAGLIRGWLGPIHPRVATIYSTRRAPRMLLVEVEDDRGPTLAEAAALLFDPIERERWVVSQIIAVCEGLEALRTRDAKYVHGGLHDEKLFIDEAGHARLRAPIPSAPAPSSSRTGGADLHAVRFVAPEQVMGREAAQLTAACDVFSLAINLQLALSGHRPFEEENSMSEMTAILQGKPARLVTHAAGLGEALRCAFLKEPWVRTATPAAFAAALRACVPDAADYDTVISDRIAAARASFPVREANPLLPREQIESALG